MFIVRYRTNILNIRIYSIHLFLDSVALRRMQHDERRRDVDVYVIVSIDVPVTNIHDNVNINTKQSIKSSQLLYLFHYLPPIGNGNKLNILSK